MNWLLNARVAQGASPSHLSMSFSKSTVGEGSPSLGASPPANSSMLASRSPTLSPRLRSPGGPEGTEKESSLPASEAGE